MVLRRGLTWEGGKWAWSVKNRAWLRSLRMEHVADQIVLDEYLLALQQVEGRVKALAEQIEVVSQEPRYAGSMGALRCFRGIDTVTGMGLVAELHDFARFESARGPMSFVGLVPSEHSSGECEKRGGITKAGNSHARRLLIEAAWHYRHRPGMRTLALRRRGQPARVIAIADKAMSRLHRRFHRLVAKGKPTPKVAVAIARELVGFIWAALRPMAAA